MRYNSAFEIFKKTATSKDWFVSRSGDGMCKWRCLGCASVFMLLLFLHLGN